MKFPAPKLALYALALAAVCSLLTHAPDAESAFAQKLKKSKVSKVSEVNEVSEVGADAHSCSAIEQELLHEINLARTKPAEYAAFLENLKPLYSGNHFKQSGGKPPVITVEGWRAVEEAITAMRASRPVAALAPSTGMCCGAGELTKDQKKSGRTGHQGSDGSYCEQRAERFGTWTAPIGENLSYGRLSARERVLGLLIDDGVSNRGHRKRLLDPGFKVVGIACDEHTSEETLCVITLAGGFTEKFTSTKSGGDKPSTGGKPARVPSDAKRF
ncbi:MAG TPA: CAP domain-containing protein [Pyrinomonadaceae bacterium]|nr:CAP domain-containing protein [Pyrinomonadaceae bacterium]